MNKSAFFDKVRSSLYGGKLTALQVKGLEAILSVWDGAPRPYVAYGLATALAETGRNMQPVREGFKATDAASRAYVKRNYWTMKNGKPGYGRPAGPFDHVYYGRGYVQLTWLANYERATEELGVNFVRDPDKALVPAYAALIMRRGMEQGWFTGKKLSDYLDRDKPDYRGARRIINGTDRAQEIAGYARAFEEALQAAEWGGATQVAAMPSLPEPVEENAVVAGEPPWWEKSPIMRQATNTFSALGIGGASLLGLDKSIVLTLVVVIGLVSCYAIYVHSRKRSA